MKSLLILTLLTDKVGFKYMNYLRKKQIIFSIFSLFALTYFSVISNLDVSSFWRGELALIPLQILAIVYVTYLRWQS
jgi:hypothetical protein